MNEQHIKDIQELLETAEYTVNAWKEARNDAKAMGSKWKDNPEVQEAVRQYLVLNKAELTMAEIHVVNIKERFDITTKQKVITLSSEQYDRVLELIHEERDCAGSLLADEDNRVVGTEREEVKADYELLGDISGLIYKQTK